MRQRPGQADSQTSIVDDRKHLFDGSLAYDPSVSVSVGDSLTYDVRLTARGAKSSHGTAQAAGVECVRRRAGRPPPRPHRHHLPG
ncbi:hypothetical protein [Streptomyces sp. NPDC002078]